MYGSDQSASIEASSLKSFAASIKAINSIKGDGIKKITKSEEAARNKLRVTVK